MVHSSLEQEIGSDRAQMHSVPPIQHEVSHSAGFDWSLLKEVIWFAENEMRWSTELLSGNACP